MARNNNNKYVTQGYSNRHSVFENSRFNKSYGVTGSADLSITSTGVLEDSKDISTLMPDSADTSRGVDSRRDTSTILTDGYMSRLRANNSHWSSWRQNMRVSGLCEMYKI